MANPRVTENAYFSNGRTYQKLYEYYLPEGLDTSPNVYYSTLYMKSYTDGYGYDFYYGGYGFYEQSVLPLKPILARDDELLNILLFITVASIIGAFAVCSCCLTVCS